MEPRFDFHTHTAYLKCANGTMTIPAIEINAEANLCNGNNPPAYLDEYADYLAAVAAEGCCFSLGSDAHDIRHLADVRATWDMVKRLGLPPERIWSPAGEPFRKTDQG
jgi:histidinol phosphatase-like PHP family hydrolase